MLKSKTYDSYLGIFPKQLQWSAIMIVSGGVLFWTGAFTPPYKQWYTSDLVEFLTIIEANQVNWYFIHATMILGVLTTLLGIKALEVAVRFSDTCGLLMNVLSNAFFVGTVLLILSFGFRLVVTTWAAAWLDATGSIETLYKPLSDWNGFIFSAYMMLSYFSLGLLGLALRDIAIIPRSVTLFCSGFGFTGMVGYPGGVLFFEPPLMIHLPLLIIGVVMLFKIRLASQSQTNQ